MGQLGNASRVPVVGPDFVNSDFSVIKQFALPWREAGLNFRAEFFNLLQSPAVWNARQRRERRRIWLCQLDREQSPPCAIGVETIVLTNDRSLFRFCLAHPQFSVRSIRDPE